MATDASVRTYFDWTSAPVARGLRTLARLRAGESEPLADPSFGDEVSIITTAEGRREAGERLRRIRKAAA